jgi:mono/diheme cytochrome c family protein
MGWLTIGRGLIGSALIAATLALLLIVTRPVGLPVDALPHHSAEIGNGERIFHAGGCASCHSSTGGHSDPPVLGGGLELDTPFGLFRVPNISPHPSSGIGRWSMLDFVNAMHLGVSPGGKHYYPAFPYTSYTRMSLEDLMDLKTYLDSLPLADTQIDGHDLDFPWNIRAGIGIWKLVNLDPAFITVLDDDEVQLIRGRYLVEGPGHCGECHTARNWTGGLEKSRWLAGAANPEGEGRVPNITPHKNGLAGWSEGDIDDYLETGFTPDFDTVGGSMVKVQENMARLPAQDRAAIAAYLKAIPPIE